ncbi:GDP-mannose 4,6-dehydratase [Herminiimonas arsenitoxidans]|uniref:GDP-mannose 4,6-dehydratase n=1 Tax=Herminiimonas arsenitoxidans TaxID=1809410 RepID=UPI0009704636|nr:GDP-mannose 4,6-dehydratase [Herminiimonas arsenitoxidans]
MKRALITGINGQDGSYLAELLLTLGYEVHGIVRREAIEDASHRLVNILHLIDKLKLHVGAVDNHLSIYKIVANVRPDECYHLAASSFVSYTFDDEASVLSNNFTATHALLASVKELSPHCRVYFAGSSEMFGNARFSPQNESTPFNPRSVYGISKLAAFHLARNYREHHKLFVAAGILYNHESPRRGYQFVTRKISTTVAKIHLGLADRLELGNIDALRDWGYAPDYVVAMHAMLQQEKPEDYVIATGVLHSVRDFLSEAFSVVGLDYEAYIHTNLDHFRPGEVVSLCGDSSKARHTLGWQPTKSFKQMVKEMVLTDIEHLERNQ